ncbi:MAG: AAA family ATPase [Gammaproteobacteria bacterium]|nr:AAA family ATPase [Gammaproteobacteria bacterium]
MKTISLLAQKGGAGKTTLSIHLAVRANLDGLKVLLVDIDPQASALGWWRRRHAEQPELIQGSGDKLADILSRAARQSYDLVVVDTAPHSSQDARICSQLSDRVYIPTRPAILDLDAIGVSTDLVSAADIPAMIILNACPPPTLFGEPKIVAEARQALQTYQIPVCPVAISQRAAFGHALIDGRAINEFDPKGKAAAEIDRLWQTVQEDVKL